MEGLHSSAGTKGIVMALILEFLFLGFCSVIVNQGIFEIRRKKSIRRNFALILLGFVLAGLSVYMTVILIRG